MSTASDVSNTGEKKVVTFKIRHEDPYRFRIAYTDENADQLYELFQQKIAEFDRPISKIFYGDNSGVDQIANANDLKVAMQQSGDYLKLYAIVDDGNTSDSNSSSASEDKESLPVMSCGLPKPDANDAADAKDANSAFESEDQPWSVTITPDNEKPITFRIYQGEPIEFDLTYKDKDELWKALQQKLAEIGAPSGKLYYIVYPFDYSLIESADDLIAAILPDRPLKLFTTAAEADDTSTSSSSSEDDSSIRGHHSHRRRRHRFKNISKKSFVLKQCDAHEKGFVIMVWYEQPL
ncbi:hypothetical protein GCK32_007405 [Trichostrongylus colubriformis]|uniref:Uncharacterized protein n=1 Tax=Trichostrongylus colubriformis TaxID=6319 RepID=A0AAN8FCD0_TRICO